MFSLNLFGGAVGLVMSTACVVSQAGAQPIPVADFSFEDAPASGFAVNPPGSPWDFSGGAGIVGQQFAFAAETVATEGAQLGFLQGAASVAQNIIDPALTPLNGQTLFLSFDAAGRVTNATDGLVSVNIYDVAGGNMQNVGIFTIPIGEVSDNPDLNGLRVLTKYEAEFVMPSFGDRFRIELSHTNPGGGDVSTVIDNVQLTTESAVPEPGSVSLAAGAICLLMRRRRNSGLTAA